MVEETLSVKEIIMPQNETRFHLPPGMTLPGQEQDEEQGTHHKHRKCLKGRDQNIWDNADKEVTLPVTIHALITNGLLAIGVSRGRWETLIEVVKGTRPRDGRAQVYIIKELQGEIIELVNSSGLQSVFLETFKRIRKSNMTTTCLNIQEAEAWARRLWDQRNNGKAFLLR